MAAVRKRVKQSIGEQILEAFVCQCSLLAVVIAGILRAKGYTL